jgi:hypothetical protein
MDGPFVIRAMSTIHPGKAESYQPLVQEICRDVEEGQPRVLAFNIWVDEQQTREVVLQIHPDALSLENHLRLLGEKVRSTFAYTDFEALEVYGPPSERLRTMFTEESGGVHVAFFPVHWGGFTRLAPAPGE